MSSKVPFNSQLCGCFFLLFYKMQPPWRSACVPRHISFLPTPLYPLTRPPPPPPLTSQERMADILIGCGVPIDKTAMNCGKEKVRCFRPMGGRPRSKAAKKQEQGKGGRAWGLKKARKGGRHLMLGCSMVNSLVARCNSVDESDKRRTEGEIASLLLS